MSNLHYNGRDAFAERAERIEAKRSVASARAQHEQSIEGTVPRYGQTAAPARKSAEVYDDAAFQAELDSLS